MRKKKEGDRTSTLGEMKGGEKKKKKKGKGKKRRKTIGGKNEH